MPTIYSTSDGQVVQATDAQGAYYYLADELGTLTRGGWEREDDAIAALEGESHPEPTIALNSEGRRLLVH